MPSFDPEWDEGSFAAITSLPSRPAGWRTKPLWSEWGPEIRLRSFGPSNFHGYVKGYLFCVEAVLTRLASDEDDLGNYLALPLLGILRHGVELAMKDILHSALELGYEADDARMDTLLATHDLQYLARNVTKLLEKQERGGKLHAAWRHLKPYMEWWQVHDPQNALGRYPMNRRGEILGNGDTVDIHLAIQVARGVFSAWYHTWPWLDAMHEARADAPQYTEEGY